MGVERTTIAAGERLDRGVAMLGKGATEIGFKVLVLTVSIANARAEPPSTPEFSGPVVEAPAEAAEPATEAKSKPANPQAKPPSPTDTSHQPLLILPGMSNARASALPRPASAAPPSVTLSTPMPIDPAPDGSSNDKADRFESPSDLPMSLESIPNDEPAASETPKKPRESTNKPANSRSNPMLRPNPNLRRPSSFWGRFFAPTSRGRWEDDGEGIRVDSKSDPAADAAMKRRVERQIRESVGSKLKGYDVRVVGREVVIRAQAARFWQKRSAKTAIEALPSLAGYKTSVEIVD